MIKIFSVSHGMGFIHDLNLTSGVLWSIFKYSKLLLDFIHVSHNAEEMLLFSVAGTNLNNKKLLRVPWNGLHSRSKFDIGSAVENIQILITSSRLLSCLAKFWRNVTSFRCWHTFEKLKIFSVLLNWLHSRSKFDLREYVEYIKILVTSSRLFSCLANCWRNVTSFRCWHKFE